MAGRPASRPAAARGGVGVVEHSSATANASSRVNEQVVGLAHELADVEVVDHLLEEIVGVLDQRDVAVDVAGGAEPGEDLQAEAVGGLDGGGVEVGDRLGEPVAASPARRAARPPGAARCRRPGVATPARAAASPSAALTSRSRTRSRSSPVAMRVKVTTRRRSAAGPVGDVAGRQRGDREGLARAGARLEQRHPGGSGPQTSNGRALVRLPATTGRGHVCPILSRSSRPSQSRRGVAAEAESARPVAQPTPSSSRRRTPRRDHLENVAPPRARTGAPAPVLLVAVVRRLPLLPRRLAATGSSLRGGGRCPGSRRLAEERQGLAHAPLVELDESCRWPAPCPADLRRAAPSGPIVAADTARREPLARPTDRQRLEGPIRGGGASTPGAAARRASRSAG